jgi:REP element-mobilizing transposase RayT
MNKGLEIFEYVMMTNHVHVIVRSKEGKLSDIVREILRSTLQVKFWS